MATGFVLENVTFGITAFNRPHLLTQLVHSILRNYPLAKIVVADNGRRKAVLPSNVRVIHLPFDSGLSATRNALTQSISTELMLLLEEDFFFLPSTRIEPLLEVLNYDPEVGVVGGGMLAPNGQVVAYSMDIEVFRETMYVRESSHRLRITSLGTPYRICDLIWNYALFRKQMLADHAWDETLKVGEHTPYFNEVKKGARWRVACCPESVIHHVPDRRSEEYRSYRLRAREMFHQYLRRNGLTNYRRIAPRYFENSLPANPNVIVLGVGHSGTSVLAKMLHRAGWQAGDADQQFGESVSVRRVNQYMLRTGAFPAKTAMRTLLSLPEPWAIKDPRFVWTLARWLPLFARLPRPPVLLRIRREHDAVLQSYQKRNAAGDVEAMVKDRQSNCNAQYERWPWSKCTLQFEQFASAVQQFDHRRSQAANPTAEAGNQPVNFSLADDVGWFADAVSDGSEGLWEQPGGQRGLAALHDGSGFDWKQMRPRDFTELEGDGSPTMRGWTDDGSPTMRGWIDDGSPAMRGWTDDGSIGHFPSGRGFTEEDGSGG